MTVAISVLDLKSHATRHVQRQKFVLLGGLAIVLAYLTYVFFAFDFIGLYQKSSSDNAMTLIRDSYSHKVHVVRDNRSGLVEIKIEGENKGEYPKGASPDWVEITETDTVIELPDGHVITFGQTDVEYFIPDYGTIWAEGGRRGVEVRLPSGNIPDFISQSKNRLMVKTDQGRLTVTRNRAEVFRYFLGWELFFFTLDSPYHGLSLGELIGRAFNGELGAMISDFWNNKMWLHKDVAWAIFETILMAFLGTFGAAVVALPLAFPAAKNFAPLRPLRLVLRRIFDFIRGVDALVFTIMLSRAFGPGPMTGALAILITDTGTFGKLFSETLENVDQNQVEGIQSTGAKPVQRYRFGVIPQVMPVLMSLVLYFFESNTRSATIIGAITGGGIGLLLTQAMTTQKDWEEVSYYVILIILMVVVMDWLSGLLRSLLIKGKENNMLS